MIAVRVTHSDQQGSQEGWASEPTAQASGRSGTCSATGAAVTPSALHFPTLGLFLQNPSTAGSANHTGHPLGPQSGVGSPLHTADNSALNSVSSSGMSAAWLLYIVTEQSGPGARVPELPRWTTHRKSDSSLWILQARPGAGLCRSSCWLPTD